MRLKSTLAISTLVVVVALPSPNARADELSTRSLTLTSVTGARYMTNPNLTTLAPLDASAAAQTLGVTFTQKLSTEWSISVGGSGAADRENRKGFSSDFSSADLALSYKGRAWTYTVSGSSSWDFAPSFQPLSTRYRDIGFSATSDNFDLSSVGTIQLQYGIRERFHDATGSSHVSPVLGTTFRRPLSKDWLLTASLIGRYTQYIDNPLATKDFSLSKQVSATTKFSDAASLKFSAVHDDRYSNVSSRTADGWTLGASLTISQDVLGRAK
jgi:hypothetical protein